MRGINWRRWTWARGGLLSLVSACMRVAWLYPLVHVILNNQLVVPRGTEYPAWLILALFLAAVVWARTSQDLPAGRLRAVLGGLLAILGALIYLFQPGIEAPSQWLVHLCLTLIDFAEGVPAALVVIVVTGMVWQRGLTINWGTHHELWRSFVTGTIVLGLLVLLRDPMLENLGGLGLSGSMAAFVVSGLVALALFSVTEAVSIEQPRGSEAVALNRYWLMAVGTAVLAILLVGWILGQILSPETVAEIVHLLDPIRRFVGQILQLILTAMVLALMWLLAPLVNALRQKLARAKPTPMPTVPDLSEQFEDLQAASKLPPELETILAIVVVVAILGGIAFALARTYRRRRRRQVQQAEVIERREYIWSKKLLGDQLRGLLRRRAPDQVASPFLLLSQPDDPRQAIRLLYQHLLAESAALGHPRPPGMTPSTYQAPLGKIAPSAQGALRTLTSAYLIARYSSQTPTLAQVDDARLAWDSIHDALQSNPR